MMFIISGSVRGTVEKPSRSLRSHSIWPVMSGQILALASSWRFRMDRVLAIATFLKDGSVLDTRPLNFGFWSFYQVRIMVGGEFGPRPLRFILAPSPLTGAFVNLLRFGV
jgi:hypothetical protein